MLRKQNLFRPSPIPAKALRRQPGKGRRLSLLLIAVALSVGVFSNVDARPQSPNDSSNESTTEAAPAESSESSESAQQTEQTEQAGQAGPDATAVPAESATPSEPEHDVNALRQLRASLLHQHATATDAENRLRIVRQLIETERVLFEQSLQAEDKQDRTSLALSLLRWLREVGDYHLVEEQLTDAHTLFAESQQVAQRGLPSNSWQVAYSNAFLQAIERLLAASPQDQQEFSAAYRTLAETERLVRDGEAAQALPAAKRLVEVSSRVLGADAVTTGYFHKLLGEAFTSLGQPEQAAHHLDAAITILRSVSSSQPLLGGTLHSRAALAYKQSNLAEAERLAREGVVVREAAHGDPSVELSVTLGLLGIIHFDSGQTESATKFLERSARIAEQTLGEDNLHTAEVRYYLGRCYVVAGKSADAAPLLSSSFMTRRSRLGEENALTLSTLYYLGDALERAGETYEAIARYEQALSIARKVHDQYSLNTAVILFDLSQQYVKLKAYLKARPLLEEALTIQRLQAGNDTVRTGVILLRLADLLYQEKQYQPSERCAAEALAILERTAGGASSLVGEAAFRLATVHHLTGKREQAKPLYERAVAIHRANGNLLLQLIAHESLANLLVESNSVDEAVRQMEAAYKTVREQAPESDLFRAVEGSLRNLYQRAGRARDAEALMKKGRSQSELLQAKSGLA